MKYLACHYTIAVSLVLTLSSAAVAQVADSAGREHADRYLDLAEQAFEGRFGPDRSSWIQRIRTDREEHLAALEWMIGHEQSERALRMAKALATYSYYDGLIAEARALLDRAMAMPAMPDDMRARSEAAFFGALFAFEQGDQEAVYRLLEENLTTARQLGDRRGTARALTHLARWALREQDHVAVARYADEAAVIAREIDDVGIEANALHMVANSAEMQGDYDRAIELYTYSLEVNRELGVGLMVVIELYNIAINELSRGDPERAGELLSEGLAMAVELEDEELLRDYVMGYGKMAADLGEAERAARLFGAMTTALDKSQDVLDPAMQLSYDRYIGRLRASMDDAAFEQAWNAGKAMTLDEAAASALE